MTEHPGFGALLARSSRHRGLDAGGLAGLAGVPEPDLREVLDGAAPDPALLHRLAPALNLRTPDVFALAGVDVPEELAPLDSTAGSGVPRLVMKARRLSPGRRAALLAFVRGLPQEERTRPVPSPRPYERYEPSFGAVLVRMLANRNLTWSGGARALYSMSGLYLSAATVGQMGHGRLPITPDFLVASAHTLGIPAGHLAALADLPLPGESAPGPMLIDAAELIWETRRLSFAQVSRCHLMRW
ncbi:hypothetical protein K4B79_16230 [Streptomyces lincolnensis]|uniref:hypothetical protein n=1 Tax=Streptomyces lincolnensis TaxID=1915 RepID=UPI001E52C682|nr:hypothetical protein [Streptomyces lincolnensis]MCD7439768.1 hypothetical protein [Streptomyces lincolnensis]